MAAKLAVANQKGGVAKTTTVHALAVAMAQAGRRVLVVDLDPQACLTYSCGVDPDGLASSLHDVLARRTQAADVVRQVRGGETSGRQAGVGEAGGQEAGGGVWLLPASIDLAGAEAQLLTVTGREHALAMALAPIADDFDVVVMDCPPSLGVLTINGLCAADALVVPVQSERLSQRGLGQLLQTVGDVRAFANPTLEVLGVIATMHDPRTRHAREVVEAVGTVYGLEVMEPAVPRSVRFAEAPGRGRSIIDHAPSSRGAAAYRALAAELLGRLDRFAGPRDGPAHPAGRLSAG